eukprot:30499_1
MHINSLNLSDQTHDSLQNYFLITNYGDRRTILIQVKKRFQDEEDNNAVSEKNQIFEMDNNEQHEREILQLRKALEESRRQKNTLAKEADRLKEEAAYGDRLKALKAVPTASQFGNVGELNFSPMSRMANSKNSKNKKKKKVTTKININANNLPFIPDVHYINEKSNKIRKFRPD